MAVELNPLESARAEKERLVRNIENTKAHLKTLEDKLAAVGKTIDILAPAYEPVKENPALAVLDPVGSALRVTEAVCVVLFAATPTYLIPTAIRNELRARGQLREDYKNEMAVIHQVLRRLEEQGKVESVESSSGKVYRWILNPDPGLRQLMMGEVRAASATLRETDPKMADALGNAIHAAVKARGKKK